MRIFRGLSGNIGLSVIGRFWGSKKKNSQNIMVQYKSDIYNMITLTVFFTGILCEFFVSFSGALIGGYKEPFIIVAGMALFSITSLLAYDYKFFFTRNRIIELLIYLIIIVYSLLCYKYQHTALVLRISLVLISSRILSNRSKYNIVRSVLKIFFFGTGIVLLIFGILSAFGVYGSFSVTQNFRHTPETRYCFGFFHPNGFSIFYLKFILLGLYLYFDKIKLVSLFVLSIVLSVPLILSDSKMVLICYLFACILCLITKFAKGKDISKLLFITSIMMICIILVVVVISGFIDEGSIAIGNPQNLWDYFNDITSGRLYSMSKSFHSYYIRFFGYGNTLTTTENGYVNALFSEGLMFVCLFFTSCIWLLYRMYKSNNSVGIIVVTAVIMSLFSESFMAYFNKNIVWMLMMGYIGNRSVDELKPPLNDNEEKIKD